MGRDAAASTDAAASGAGSSDSSVLSKFLSRQRKWQPADEPDEGALWLPEVAPQDAAVLSTAGGDLGRLEALLRANPRTQLFNAALRTAPDAALPRLLDLLTACCRPDHLTVRTLLHRLPRAGMSAEVDGTMRRLLGAGLPPTYKSFLPWASLRARQGSVAGVRHVMQLVEELCGGPAAVGAHYYVQLVRAYNTAGRWRETDTVLEEMKRRGVEPSDHVYRAVIFAHGRHHRADRARAVFDEMVAAGQAPSPATWCALVNAYADSRQPVRAVEALLGMRKQGVAPSVEVWGALTKAFARSGDWRRALEVIEVMQAEGLAPNEQVWGCAIEAAATAGKPSVAAELLRRMAAAGVPPNVIAYTSLLSAYGATRDTAAAERVLADMAAAGCRPNSKTYTELMAQLAARGKYKECERYFNQMIEEGWPADKVSFAILFDSMLQRWAADRDAHAALLATVEARWEEASRGGVMEPHTYLHQPQGRLTVDLHGYSPWTAQLAVLTTLRRLMAAHVEHGSGGITAHISRLDIITGRGNRSARRHHPVVREAVLEMLQHLLPVSLARSNEGLLVLEARQLRRLFDSMLSQGRSFSLAHMQHCLVEPPGQRRRGRVPDCD